jgi:hypothetical protein
MFSATAPATPTLVPDAPEVAVTVVLNPGGAAVAPAGGGGEGVVAWTLMVGADRLVVPVLLAIVAVLLARVSLIATATPTLSGEFEVVDSPSAMVDVVLVDDASILIALVPVTLDESTYA